MAVIALLLVYSMQDNEISGPGSDAGSALLASGGNVFVAAGEDAASASDEKELEENGLFQQWYCFRLQQLLNG